MTSRLLESIAEEHFSKATHKSLIMEAASRINEDNMFEFFLDPNLLVRRAATKLLFQKSKVLGFKERIVQGLRGDARLREGILTTLSYGRIPYSEEVVREIKENLNSDSREVRIAAAKAIAYRYPEHAACLIPLLKDDEIAKIACFSQNSEIAWDLVSHYGFPEKIPPALGFLLNPKWLAGNYRKNQETVSRLILEYGYSNFNGDMTELLSKGFMFVSEKMGKSDFEFMQKRISDFEWQILPAEFGLGKNFKPLNLEDNLDIDLFFAAIRESDVQNLEVRKSRDPFNYRHIEGLRSVLCCHAPYRYFKRLLIDDGLELAEELKVRKDDYGKFILERAKALLEIEDEKTVEMELLLRSKWLALSRKSGNPYPRKLPAKEDEDFPIAKFAVINDFKLPAQNPRLSPGANSVVNLGKYFGFNLENKLAELEEFYSKHLLPVGIEIQTPRVDYNTSFAWKQALRFFGVPSPRRPEYKDMIEAAFRPSRSFHAPILGVMLMHKLGIFNYEQEMAFHISVQGDLGDKIRYIAFPHQFFNRSRRNIENQDDRFKLMARLMSKGFVNLNKDIEHCFGNAEYRTEVRVYRCQTDKVNGKIELRMSYTDDLISTHLLASASKSEDERLRSLWDDYTKEIENYTGELPWEFKELLDADWYESTGDPRDGRLVGMLPVVRKREKILEMLKNMDKEKIGNDFSAIVGKYASLVHRVLTADRDFDNLGLNASCSYGIPYFLPQELSNL